VNTLDGKMTHAAVTAALGKPHTPLEDVLS
jgi:hypothetical protein